jgi:hypothetical protein
MLLSPAIGRRCKPIGGGRRLIVQAANNAGRRCALILGCRALLADFVFPDVVNANDVTEKQRVLGSAQREVEGDRGTSNVAPLAVFEGRETTVLKICKCIAIESKGERPRRRMSSEHLETSPDLRVAFVRRCQVVIL